MLDTTEVAVNRALHSARLAIEQLSDERERAALPGSAEERDLVSRFTTAFEAGDIPGVVSLLTDDDVLQMPPEDRVPRPSAIAAFCHPAPDGSRFNSADRVAWYAGFEVETSQAEVAYHKQLWLQETDWNEEEIADYVDYGADFRAEFHDIRGTKEHAHCLSPTSYAASPALADAASGDRLRGYCLSQRPPLWWNLHRVFSAGFSDEHTERERDLRLSSLIFVLRPRFGGLSGHLPLACESGV